MLSVCCVIPLSHDDVTRTGNDVTVRLRSLSMPTDHPQYAVLVPIGADSDCYDVIRDVT